MSDTNCPCGSNTPYLGCCGRFHKGLGHAETAEQLMRSRYSAYAVGEIDYLIQTTLPAQQSSLDKNAIEEWATQTLWQSLTIVATEKGQTTDPKGVVEFIARYTLPPATDIHEHQERSDFCQQNRYWYFIDPTVKINAKRNDPCPCGSGQKYKKCCG